ncbi:MAG: cell division protein FtsZ, partial [Patescibacteria group bacterium]|nr:cell division protein FtsZ [Patescibacteria group bacterium]
YEEHILADLKASKNVIVAGHGNTLRAIMKHLDNVPDDKVHEVEARGVSDAAVEGMDLELDKTDPEANFAEEPTHNIWDSPVEEDDESDIPAFLRRRKKHKKTDEES